MILVRSAPFVRREADTISRSATEKRTWGASRCERAWRRTSYWSLSIARFSWPRSLLFQSGTGFYYFGGSNSGHNNTATPWPAKALDGVAALA